MEHDKNFCGAIKDDLASHPIATNWRSTIREVVHAFVHEDYALAKKMPRVATISPAAAKQIESYVAHYGETLVELPDDTWSTSVAQWMGTHWEVVVDLWTIESNASDLILQLRVLEVENDFRFEVEGVYVP